MFDRPAIQRYIATAHKRSYPPKHTLMHAGDPPQSIYLILEGSVSVLLEDEQGREVVLAYLNPGDFFGEMCLFPSQTRRSAIVRTRRPTLVAEMGLAAFRDYAAADHQIMFEIAEQLAIRLHETNQRVADLTFHDVAARLARTLQELGKKPDAQPREDGVVVRISRQELARLVGCSREMAGRVLKRLEEGGMLSSQGRNILLKSHFEVGAA